MAVGFDAKMTAGNSADGLNQQVSAATTITSTTGMTVGASASLLIIVLALQNTSTVTNVAATWNGVSATLRSTVSVASSNRQVVAILRLLAPASGTRSLQATWTSAADCYMSCISFTGTDTTTGTQDTDDRTATNTTSITVPSSTDGATVAVFCTDGSTPTMNFTKIWAEAPLAPGGGGSYQLAGTSNAHTFTGAGGTAQALAGVHVIAAAGGGGGRTLFLPSGLDGLSTSGPKQFNPSLGYHRTPAISLEAYRREQALKHREFMRKVRAA